jgi:hypothetical protein
MRGVFERVFRATAVLTLLLVLVVPAAYADDPPGTLDARINPPIGATCVEELSYFDLFLIWAEAGLLTPVL